MNTEKKDTIGIIANDLLIQAIKSFANEMVNDVAGENRGNYSSDPYRETVNDLVHREIKEIFKEKKSIVRDIIRQSLINRLNESLLCGKVPLDADRAIKFVRENIIPFKGMSDSSVGRIVNKIIEEARGVDLDAPGTNTYWSKYNSVIREIDPKEGMLFKDKEDNACTASYYKNSGDLDHGDHWRVSGPSFPGGFSLGWALLENIVIPIGE